MIHVVIAVGLFLVGEHMHGPELGLVLGLGYCAAQAIEAGLRIRRINREVESNNERASRTRSGA